MFELNSPSPLAVNTSSERIARGNELQTPFIARLTQELKEGKLTNLRVLIVGSGQNSPNWNQLGYDTLDIDPNSGAKFIFDANKLSLHFSSDQYDLIFTECLSIDEGQKIGVNALNFMKQAYDILKPGGRLLIQTACIIKEDLDGKPAKMPLPNVFQTYLRQIGYMEKASYFGDMKLSRPVHTIGDKKVASSGMLVEGLAIYHGRKPIVSSPESNQL